MFFFAIFKQCNVTSFGISSWVKKIFEFLIKFICLSISLIVNDEGAPTITFIAFFPEFLSTKIPATPV